MKTIEDIARELGKGKEKKVADGWVTTCPAHDDGKASLSLRNPHGKILFKCHAGCDQKAVMDAMVALGVWKTVDHETWKPIRPIPDDVKVPTTVKHSKHGEPVRSWEYRELDGKLIGFVHRFEDEKGKTLIPMCYCYSDKGNRRWMWKSFDKPRPLYNLPLFRKLKDAPVIVFEGEKAADAAQKIFGDRYICTAWPGGAAAVKFADVSTLKGRKIYLWPDNDEPGLKAMNELADIIRHEVGVVAYMISVPEDLPSGWDIADDIPEGFDVEPQQLINLAEPYTPSSDLDVARMNKEHAFIISGGKPTILWERRDRKDGTKIHEFWSLEAFKAYYGNETVPIGRTQMKLGEYWMQHPERRSYRGLVFEPGSDTPGFYNLWQGFTYEPDGSGEWTLFYEHLYKNVCQGDENLFNWVFAWFAHIVQHPTEKAGTSISIRGNQGSGKTIVGKIFGRLIKKHYTLIDQERYLFGNFNAHLASTLLLHSDEGFWGGDPRNLGRLKSLVTSDTHRIEQKGRDSLEVNNYIRLMITSNEDWVVPAAFDERRFAILDIGNGNQQDTEFFVAMLKQMENGGYGALLYDLLNFDLGSVDVHRIPETTALTEQKEASMGPVEAYWFACLQQGNTLLMNKTGWLGTVKTGELHDDFITYATRLGYRRLPHLNVFFRRLRKLVPEDSMKRRLVGPHRESAVTLPSLTEARYYFDSVTRTNHDWLSYDMGEDQDYIEFNTSDPREEVEF